jgi:hypothetical protein
VPEVSISRRLLNEERVRAGLAPLETRKRTPRRTPEPSVPCNDTMPNKPVTPLRSIRISDTLWQAAQAKAAEKGETVTDVIRAALEKYVRSKS